MGNVSAETVSITEGERLSLNCTVQDAVGRVMFQWQAMRNRETELNITSAANRSSLFINHVTVMDEGLYYCVAMDYQSQITKQYNATVNGEKRSKIISLSLTICFTLLPFTM